MLKKYILKNERNNWLATVILDSNNTNHGNFFSITDYGNFCYNWNSTGYKDFREFILKCNYCYLAEKLTSDDRKEEKVDVSKSIDSLIENLLKYRYEYNDSLTKEDCRYYYEELKQMKREHENILPGDFHSICEEASFVVSNWWADIDFYDFVYYNQDNRYEALIQIILPNLKDVLSKELENEKIQVKEQ